MEECITQVIWNGFVILTAVLTTFGAIIVTLVNCFRKGWQSHEQKNRTENRLGRS